MALTITHTTTFVVHDCPTCHMQYALPQDFRKRMQQTSGTWYCPRGHAVCYTESALDRARRELKIANRQLESALYARDSEYRRWRGERVQHGKTKARLRRTAAGLCPHCNRNFENLRRHMETKHPEKVAECRHGVPADAK